MTPPDPERPFRFPWRRRSRSSRVLGWGLAIAWAAFLFLQSSSSTAGSFLAFLPPGADKVAHGVAFGLLGALVTLGSGNPWLGVLSALLYGVSDEYHQSFVPGRSVEFLDVVADTVGGALGAFFVDAWARRCYRGSLE